MYDSVEDRFNALENFIKRHTAALVTSGLHGEPADATLASQKSAFVVGMVCCDGEGHLNEKSILLQGSVEYCAGQRVRLDLQKLDKFSIFPGQVIGIEGQNPSGHCLIASKVIDSLPLSISHDEDMPPTKKQAMDQEFQPTTPSSASGELSLVIAAGPFPTTDNLLFEPLAELLSFARRRQPQLLILLQDYVEYMGQAARVVLVPSARVSNHNFVFPQITCLPNPGFFKVNEVMVSSCIVDILKQLSSEEIWRMPQGSMPGDRMGRLATHLLRQRSFYPLYPPSKWVPLDLSLSPEALRITSIPYLLILPSDLAPFVKVVI